MPDSRTRGHCAGRAVGSFADRWPTASDTRLSPGSSAGRRGDGVFSPTAQPPTPPPGPLGLPFPLWSLQAGQGSVGWVLPLPGEPPSASKSCTSPGGPEIVPEMKRPQAATFCRGALCGPLCPRPPWPLPWQMKAADVSLDAEALCSVATAGGQTGGQTPGKDLPSTADRHGARWESSENEGLGGCCAHRPRDAGSQGPVLLGDGAPEAGG